MKVSVVNTWDTSGGAARAAYRLASHMRGSVGDLTYFVGHKDSNLDWVTQISDFQRGVDEQADIQSQYYDNNRTGCSDTYFSSTRADISDHWVNKIADSDVINLHWVERFISTKTISKLLARDKPVVWTLHDERPLTGGCHYTSGCMQHVLNGCRNCIQLTDDPDLLPAQWLEEKISTFREQNVTIVTPSVWLGEVAKRSQVFRNHRVEVIPNSLDTKVFQPRNKALARSRLNLPEDKFIMLFGAQNTTERRKGYQILIDAMRLFLNRQARGDFDTNLPVGVLIFGEYEPAEWNLPAELFTTGTINDDNRLADVYSAADCFVIPSSEDNLPNTILEALACATPVIGFDIGGIPDLVKPNRTGYLSPLRSPLALSQAISNAYLDQGQKLDALGIRAADFIRSNFTQETQVRAYLDLYEDMIS